MLPSMRSLTPTTSTPLLDEGSVEYKNCGGGVPPRLAATVQISLVLV